MAFPPPCTAFISLLDNYESDTGEPEIVTPEEVAENHKFLDSIIQTQTMKVDWKRTQTSWMCKTAKTLIFVSNMALSLR